jgi:hypothetical protein
VVRIEERADPWVLLLRAALKTSHKVISHISKIAMKIPSDWSHQVVSEILEMTLFLVLIVLTIA